MTYTGIELVFGAASVGHAPFQSVDEVTQLLDALEASGIKIIDTAQLYGDSEALLGKAGASKRFVIDTKDLGGFDKENTTERIVKRGKESLEKLDTQKVDVFYLHAPSLNAPLATIVDTLAGVDALYKAGVFSRFGLSNFKPEQVEAVYKHCQEKNYVLPTVYQGNYSPVARRQEELLFPTLRKLGMSFYAYSPLAGGFLTKTREKMEQQEGRFKNDTVLGQMYRSMYNKPSYLDALDQWQAIANKEGVSAAELGFRWVAHNSPLKPEHGDALIMGASRLEQVSNTVKAVGKGPLSQEAVAGIDKMWETIEKDAPLDNWNDYAVSIL